MSCKLEVTYQKKKSYDIIIENSYEKLPSVLTELFSQDQKLCIVTDRTVEKLYADQIMKLTAPLFSHVEVYSFAAGEENKNLDTVKSVYRFLIEKKFGRKDVLAALGGGVTGDLTGFVAATYLRGVDFFQLPTTLLSQVDSSIGGKTGVDFDQFKNMVGAFKMPKLVFINTDTLKTLPARQFASGMAEVLKAGLIRDSIFYEWLITNFMEINEKDPAIMEELISRSCGIKRTVVEKDPLEQNERALLNFGHTLGHAIEKYKDFSLLHGECVALGAVAAAYISWKKELLSMEEYYEIRDMFVPFRLPISVDHILADEIVALTKSDKKAEGDHIKFILLKKIGKAFISKDVTEEEMLAALLEIEAKDAADD
ncbi:MAG TPA: 3-dehydroquinate synthase [Lachnospiraceae bacterium]|nr:3-dehydroquinate synthase [Lachnospiraceae bacterium]